MGSADELSYLELPVANFLGLVSAPEPAPGGGSAAALTIALAAALCVMAARLSARQMPDAPDLAAAAEQLRDRVASLCQADADAYSLVVSAMRQPEEPDPDEHRRGIAAALSVAADVALEVVQIASRVAAMAARLAEVGNPNLRGDAVTAALLSDSGARSAGGLVLIDLEGSDADDDDRISQLEVLLAETTESAGRARRTISGL